MLIPLEDPGDPRLAPFRWKDRQLASRLERQERIGAGMFVAEGDLVVGRAMAAGCEPVALLCDQVWAPRFDAEMPSVPVYVGDEPLRQEVTGLGVPLGAVGLFRRPPLLDVDRLIENSSRIVVIEAVDNPTNLGAIIRSATALGWDAVLLTEGSADPLARRALRVSMGAGLHMPFARLAPGESTHGYLREHGHVSIALTPSEDAVSLEEVRLDGHGRVAVMLGSERDGLSAQSMHGCDMRVRIPMHHGTDSLNVAAAAAIAMWALGPGHALRR